MIANKFSLDNLDYFKIPYTNINLGKMVIALNNGNTEIPHDNRERLVEILQKVVCLRLEKEGCKSDPFIVAQSFNGHMDIINANKALKAGADCLPIDYPKKHKLVYKYRKPTGAYLINNKALAYMTKEEMDKICNAPCACSSFPSRYIDKHHGHVITNKPCILNRYSLNLAKIAHEGSKFRTGLKYGKFTTEDRKELIAVLNKACDKYISARIDEGLVQGWSTWKGIVMNALIAEIDLKLI